jgi:hypothetical protein
MIAAVTSGLALLYCFVWLRIPDALGLALPFQRLLAWSGFLFLCGVLAMGRSVRTGAATGVFLRFVVVFWAMLAVNLLAQVWYGRQVYLLYFLMDFSKYVAVFSAAFLTYYTLRRELVEENRYLRYIIWSGAASLAIVCLLLGLYYLGFRSDVEILAHSFGGSLGVWPTGGIIPRLAGTTAEPQQLSVVYLTPLMLMLCPEHIGRYRWVAGLGMAVLLLSQSKFAVVSLLLLYVFALMVYPHRRRLLILGGLALLPLGATVLMRLPTFASLLTEGLSSVAIVERLGNILLLLSIVGQYPLFGIGAGQYGIYRGEVLYSDPLFDPGYTPNMDFLKVLAEVGLVGFLVIVAMLVTLLRVFYRTGSQLPSSRRPRFLAFQLGAIGILLNMLVGYELLHVFFWLNVGFLLYLSETSPEVGGQTDDGSGHSHGGLPDPVDQPEAALR